MRADRGRPRHWAQVSRQGRRGRVVFVDVVGRNLLNRPLPWGTELLEVVLAVLIFALYPVLALRSSHITVDLIPVPRALQTPQRLLAGAAERLAAGQGIDAMALGVAAWMKWQSGVTESGEAFVVDDPLAGQAVLRHREGVVRRQRQHEVVAVVGLHGCVR